NNWDLVDLSSPNIIGTYLLDKDRDVLYKLAKSEHLWEKRIAIISTFNFIREKQFQDSIKIAEILINDKHDLIHKAVGWMLREIGKKDKKTLEDFLNKHYKIMPRTMLRYAIEKLNPEIRKKYLKGEI
ncbi:MAG: DNA alkylation repair protein, partial [Nanoarchaeota archaeon]|nr:DNA alkylation repair protein [Nanoarchaeota archaeon]